ncbi:DUF6119 family protein [Nocardia takedensis]
MIDLNIFKIPRSVAATIGPTLEGKGYALIHAYTEADWSSEFWFLEGGEEVALWLRRYERFFENSDLPTRKNHSAVHVFFRDSSCYAIAHGSSHFHVRPLCDFDFGTNLAKRIADENDVRETAAKRYQSSRKKENRTYRSNTRLDVDSGESIDLIQSSIIERKKGTFGTTGRFGTSAILSLPIEVDGITEFLANIDAELENPELFTLPRDAAVTKKADIARFDKLLLDAITADQGESDPTTNTSDLYGVEFNSTFAVPGRFSLKHPRHRSSDFTDRRGHDLTIDDLRNYIAATGLTGADILKIKVTRYNETDWDPDLTLKQTLDFYSDSHRAVLTEGKWRIFNQDYLSFLDGHLRCIETEKVEDSFKLISGTEGNFNASELVRRAGYETADTNFDIAKTKSKTPVEAWDLKKGRTVYAVKFGPAQKLGYACDQATILLKLFSNRATVKEVPEFDRYCLWFGYTSKNLPVSIADTYSIILKQKIDAWARLCRDVGKTPVIKISQHTDGRQLGLF